MLNVYTNNGWIFALTKLAQDVQEEIDAIPAGGGGGITSVNGQTGPTVVLNASDVQADPKGAAEAAQIAAQAYADGLGATLVPTSRTIAGKPLTGNITLAKADVGLANVDNTSDANKPISSATTTALAGKVDKEFTPSSTSTSNAVVKPFSVALNVAPTAASQGIFFGNFSQAIWNSTFNLTGGGHICGAFGHGVLNATGTLEMALGVEGRIDTQAAGTITQAKGCLGLIVNQSGTITNAKGISSELNNGTGRTITNGYGYYAEVAANAGTIGKFVAYAMPNITASGITVKYFIENLDTAAPIITKSPTVQQDYGYAAATSGQTLQYPNNISDFTITPAATLAALTVALPTAPYDGQNITLSTTQAITALTLTAASGTIPNPVSTLTAGQTIEYKFLGQGVNLWVRKR